MSLFFVRCCLLSFVVACCWCSSLWLAVVYNLLYGPLQGLLLLCVVVAGGVFLLCVACLFVIVTCVPCLLLFGV